MQFAFVSDIHANLQAWNAVLADLNARNVDTIICLGDIVGYGPRPAEVLASVYTHVPDIILGNHDAVVAGRLDPSMFRDDARRMIEWTAEQLDDKAIAFFQDLPYTMVSTWFHCSHAEFSDPPAFNYLRDAEFARASWAAVDDPLLFVGHTHIPCVHVLDAQGSSVFEPRAFELEPGVRYIVNTGSVGMPRDGDLRSSYCIFDDEELVVTFHRVPFDVDAFSNDVKTLIGGNEQTDYVLRRFDELKREKVREDVDFAPAPASPAPEPAADSPRIKGDTGKAPAARKRRKRTRAPSKAPRSQFQRGRTAAPRSQFRSGPPPVRSSSTATVWIVTGVICTAILFIALGSSTNGNRQRPPVTRPTTTAGKSVARPAPATPTPVQAATAPAELTTEAAPVKARRPPRQARAKLDLAPVSFTGTVASIVEMGDTWAVAFTIDQVTDGPHPGRSIQIRGTGQLTADLQQGERYRVSTGVNAEGYTLETATALPTLPTIR
jgi:predicted phosphodiesterase